ncbi:MAG: hypothetical protein HKN17_09965 [Rhodothermales bacterium]|nr:hypothetical protein [Rhodothermales bacterium]
MKSPIAMAALALGFAGAIGSTTATAQERASATSQPVALTIPAPVDPALMVETDEPTIFWIEPDGIVGDSLVVDAAEIGLRGRLTNAGDSLSLQIGFEQVELDANGFFETDLTLRLGGNETRVRVTDLDGSVVLQRPLFVRYVDDGAPDIRVYEPVPLQRPQIHRSIRARMQFHGRVFDESPIETFTLNDQQIELSDDNRFTYSVLLEDGRINTVYMEAVDAAGNATRDSVKVVRETGLEIIPSLLSELAVRPGRLSPAFIPVEQYYTLTIPQDAETIEISTTSFRGVPTVRLFGAGLPAEGAAIQPGASRPFPIRIPPGPQTLEIRSSNGQATPVTYTIQVRRSQ